MITYLPAAVFAVVFATWLFGGPGAGDPPAARDAGPAPERSELALPVFDLRREPADPPGPPNPSPAAAAEPRRQVRIVYPAPYEGR